MTIGLHVRIMGRGGVLRQANWFVFVGDIFGMPFVTASGGNLNRSWVQLGATLGLVDWVFGPKLAPVTPTWL